MNHFKTFLQGRLDLQNITFNNDNWPSMFPSGQYKTDLNFTLGKKPLIHISYDNEFKSLINTGSFS